MRKNISELIYVWLKENDELQLSELMDHEYYVGDIVDYKTEELLFENVQIINGFIVKNELMKIDSKGACCIVAVEITAYCRNMMREAMRKIGSDKWYYGDTDSLLVSKLGVFPKEWIGNDLGQWKIEPCSSEKLICDYTIKGRKDYACKHDIYMKGVPKIDIKGNRVVTQESWNSGLFRFWKVLKPKEALRRGLQMFGSLETTKERRY